MTDTVTVAAPATPETATIFVALELSKARWLVGVHTPLADKISRYSVAGGDGAGLLALIGRIREQVARHAGGAVAVISCYEAGYDGFWLHRLLQANGVANQVMDPASLPVDRRARRAKTDRLDVEAQMRTLMAWHRGEKQVCRMVRVPSPEQEDERRRSRERERLIKERVQHISRIKGLLMAQGIRDFQPTRRGWEDRLEGLRTGDGRPLPPALKAEITRQCRRLWQVSEMIADVERERDAARAKQTAGAVDQAAMLTRLVGIGDVSATVLVNEVLYRDFSNGRQVGGYLGLGGSPYASGSVRRDQGSAAPAIRGHGGWRSSWPGCGCVINRRAGWHAGSVSASERHAAATGGSCWWRWRASSWSRCGATSPPAWCRKAPGRRRPEHRHCR